MIVVLVDGTYELFRAFYGAPSARTSDGREVAATRTLLRSLAGLLREPWVTHVAVAFDTVIESFRNQLFAGYKTGEGIDPDLYGQFALAERATRALGLVTWSMIDFEADDAIATAAARFADDPRVEQVRIASPDKDFCQCVRGERVVLFDRKTARITDEAGVHARLGVKPSQVAAYLALVGDTADGIPGIARWGEKSAGLVLGHYGTIDAIPDEARAWGLSVRGRDALASELAKGRELARLYERLATLRTDVPLTESLDDLAYRGPDAEKLRGGLREVEAPELASMLIERGAGGGERPSPSPQRHDNVNAHAHVCGVLRCRGHRRRRRRPLAVHPRILERTRRPCGRHRAGGGCCARARPGAVRRRSARERTRRSARLRRRRPRSPAP